MSRVNNVFDILDADAQHRETKRACIVAVARAKKQCGKFFAQAASEEDFMARLALVTDKLNDIVREACIEENSPDIETVHRVLSSELATVYSEIMRSDIKDENIDPTDEDAPDNMVEHEVDNRKLWGKPEDFKESASVKTGCDTCKCASCTGNNCGCCAECGPKKESSAKTAVDTGDTYSQETQTLPKADADGLADEATVPIDMASAGDELHTSQKPIDVPSVANPSEQQDVTEPADYTATLESPGVVKNVDADTPMQPEHNVAPNTQSFPNKDQAHPVTSKWKIIG